MPLESPEGLVPPFRPKVETEPKLPVPVPSRSVTVLLVKFDVARSRLPSRLKSRTTTPCGPVPIVKLVAVPKLPVPVPRRTDTESEPKLPTT
ncbi:hypothetical protein FHR37_000274 [Actinopolymorpha cephalotaxi]|uniref:Uncharacterized protein n=1 Tax=Actinopolymorpha cephalotaxi TaxID=504797 RepID=A0ABX2RVN2_9ACTN|nr:hypothetical protein [Actinopolymorpha cephalotaxi]NYH81423.1 hypothetical protein [Actinopolymorpha cephalotaxi]